MKLIIKDRGANKTTGLIYTSEATGYPIVTDSKTQVSLIKEQAENMGCNIPEPLAVSDIRLGKRLSPEMDILFDNVETILGDAINHYLNANVICATMTTIPTAMIQKKEIEKDEEV